MKKTSKDLVLSRETIQRLERVYLADLGHVQGGSDETDETESCIRRDPAVAYIE